MDLQVIEILNVLFWVCLILAIVFFALAVVQFFIFDIKSILDKKTGRAEAKAIKEMESVNQSTGRLRTNAKPQTSRLSEAEKNTSRAPAVAPPAKTEKTEYYQSVPAEGAEETNVLLNKTEEAETDVLTNKTQEAQTDVLSHREPEESATSILSRPPEENSRYADKVRLEGAETSVLSQNMIDEPPADPNYAYVKRVGFTVVKKVMLIHTNEVI